MAKPGDVFVLFLQHIVEYRRGKKAESDVRFGGFVSMEEAKETARIIEHGMVKESQKETWVLIVTCVEKDGKPDLEEQKMSLKEFLDRYYK